VRSRCLQQLNDVLDGLVGFVVGGFEFAVRRARRVGFVMEAAIGEGTAEAFVEEQKQQSNVDAFAGQAVGIAAAIALE
jgi:hypothetical protein